MTALPLPKIPTDNLYKFLALSGLLLVGFSFYWPSHQSDQWYARLDALNERIAVLNTRRDDVRRPFRQALVDQAAAIKVAIDTAKTKPLPPDFAAGMLATAQATKAQLEAEMLRMIDQDRADKEELARITTELDVVHRIEKRDALRSDECTWLSGIGAMMAFMGFLRWYTKIQKYLDRSFASSATEAAPKVS